MKRISKSLLLLFFVLQLHSNVFCKNIVIIESQSFDVEHNMDERWQSIFMEKGISVDLSPQNTLNLLDNLIDVDFLIISHGLIQLNSTQLQVIKQYIQQGGNVYLQSEYQIQSAGNQAFSQLVEHLGGSFSWLGENAGNIIPLNITGSFSDLEDPLSFFWYGAYGSGDEHIFPFLENNDKNYGFYFCSPNPEDGLLITISDQDWIRHNTNPALMHQIIDFCFQQNSFQLPQLDIHVSDNDPCTEGWVTYTADIEIAPSNIIAYKWYRNDIEIPFATDSVLIINANANQIVSCTVLIENNCSQIEITKSLDPRIEILANKTNICKGEKLEVEAFAYNLPDSVTYRWLVDNQIVPTNNTCYFSCDSIKDQQNLKCEILIHEQDCIPSNIIISNTLEITVSQMEIDIIELQPEICTNDGEIEVAAYGGIGQYSYNWSDGKKEAQRMNLAAGTYSLTITDDSNCQLEEVIEIEGNGDSIFVSIHLKEYDDKTQEGILVVETNAIEPIYSWNSSIGLSCSDCPQPLVHANHDSIYQISIVDYKGCSATSFIKMPKNNNTPTNVIYIPNVFTPNNDGSNDYFVAYGAEPEILIENMKIFNPTGLLIFEKNDILLNDEKNGWDGRDLYNNVVPSGVYIYLLAIRIDNELKIFKGDISTP